MIVESRSKRSLRNIIFAIIAYIIQLILGFIVRRYFIYVFGIEYLGVNSLFTNILSILSLAEMGFGTAILFSMYKPMSEDNKEVVGQLLNFYKKCYTIIAFIVMACGFLVLPFMNYFKTKVADLSVNLYIVYFIFLFNTVSSYLLAHRWSLLYVSQRNDIGSIITLTVNIFSSIFQILIILLVKNFYIYSFVAGLTALISNILVYFVTNKRYKEYIIKTKELSADKKKEVMKNVYSLLFHRIGGVIVLGTDNIIIFSFLNASILGNYSNYTMITTHVASLLTMVLTAISGSVGNSIATETKEHNFNLLNKLNYCYLVIVAFCSICIYLLSDDFIRVILIKDDSIQYSIDIWTLLVISLNFYFYQSRNMICTFKNSAGLYYQDRFKSIFEAIINLVTSIILVKTIGLVGVVLGTIISTLSTSLWIEPYVLNKYYLKQSTIKYFIKYLIIFVDALIVGLITMFICSKIVVVGIATLILKFIVCGFISFVLLVLTLCWMPEFKDVKFFILNFIKKRKV